MRDLQEPITFSIPLPSPCDSDLPSEEDTCTSDSDSDGVQYATMACTYWDAATEQYATDGCTALPSPAPRGVGLYWRSWEEIAFLRLNETV